MPTKSITKLFLLKIINQNDLFLRSGNVHHLLNFHNHGNFLLNYYNYSINHFKIYSDQMNIKITNFFHFVFLKFGSQIHKFTNHYYLTKYVCHPSNQKPIFLVGMR